MVRGGSGENVTFGVVKGLGGGGGGPGAGAGTGAGGGGDATAVGGGGLFPSSSSKNSPILVALMVSSTGLGGAETLPAGVQDTWAMAKVAKLLWQNL
jgi:hypothetical protein